MIYTLITENIMKPTDGTTGTGKTIISAGTAERREIQTTKRS